MYGIHVSDETKMKRQKVCIERNCDFSHEYSEEERKKASERFKEIAKKWTRKVRCIEDNLIFDSITLAAEYYSVTKSTLSGHLHGRQKVCKNKHFEFIN